MICPAIKLLLCKPFTELIGPYWQSACVDNKYLISGFSKKASSWKGLSVDNGTDTFGEEAQVTFAGTLAA